jgi:hypothetical protein
MWNSVPDKTVREVAVTCLISDTIYEKMKTMVTRFALGCHHWQNITQELPMGKGTSRACANKYKNLDVR